MLERSPVAADTIRQFAMFRDLGDDIVGEIQQQARTVSLRPGEPLFRQSDPIQRSYFCVRGRVKLFRISPEGTEKIFHIASDGDSLPDSVALGSQRRFPLHCAAVVTSELISVDSMLIIDLFNRFHAMRCNLTDVLVQRIDHLLDHVEMLSADKASLRVASYLLSECRRHDGHTTFRLKASKKHIASFLSLQPETLSRCLTAFRRDGLAETSGREIRLLDPDGLQSMVTGTRIASH